MHTRQRSKPAYSATHSQRHTYTKNPHTAIIIKGRQTQKTHTLTHTLSLKVPHLPQDLSVQVCPTSFCLAGFTAHSIQHRHQCTWAVISTSAVKDWHYDCSIQNQHPQSAARRRWMDISLPLNPWISNDPTVSSSTEKVKAVCANEIGKLFWGDFCFCVFFCVSGNMWVS